MSDFIWDEVEEKPTPKKVESKQVEQPLPSKKKQKKLFSKRKKVLLLITILLLLIIVFFAPIYTVATVEINPTYFVSSEQVMQSISKEVGQKYNFRQLRDDNINEELSKLVTDITIGYDFKTQALKVDVTEIKPLLSTSDGTFYYSDKGEIKTSTSFYYAVPKAVNFDEKNTEALVNALNKLDYKIIKEIAAIQYVKDEILPDLVAMQMMDGNIVYITISEISNKMPYYLQMSQVVEQKANGKPGIIHLERGNYYEPI